jgi:hypothetical protein
MIAEFGKSLGSKLGERWVSEALAPAGLFWVAIVLMYAAPHKLQAIILGWGISDISYIAIAFVGLVILILTASLVDSLTSGALGFLEGYWRIEPLRTLAIAVQRRTRKRLRGRWMDLLASATDGNPASLEASQRATFVRLDELLHQYPTDDRDLMPTRLGNVLRAAERRPLVRYGLDAVVCWPRLWLIIPDAARTTVQSARSALDADLRAWIYAIALCAFALYQRNWLPALAALSLGYFLYVRATASAITYGSLIVSVYDMYRTLLYDGLRLPLPTSVSDEPTAGTLVNMYLARGSTHGLSHFSSSDTRNVRDTPH